MTAQEARALAGTRAVTRLKGDIAAGIVAVVFALVGCSAEGDVPDWAIEDSVEASAALVLLPSPALRGAARAAAERWSAATCLPIDVVDRPVAGAVAVWESDASPLMKPCHDDPEAQCRRLGWWSQARGEIVVDRAEVETRAVWILLHEIGHVLGAGHVEDGGTLTAHITDGVPVITAGALEAVCASAECV